MAATSAETSPPPSRSIGPVLRVAGVSKRFGTTRALTDVSLRIGAGELVGIAGHNGAGKTTLLSIVTGQLRADTGGVELAGVTRSATASVAGTAAQGVRMVHQELSLCPTLRVDETAAVFDHAVGGIGWRLEAWRRLVSVLDEMFPGHGLRRGLPVRELSIARQQMLECACAMLPGTTAPVLLVLDEPTSALDSDATAHFYAYLRKQAERGLSAVVTTHRLHEMVQHLDRIYVMRDGAIVTEQGSDDATIETLVSAMGVGAPRPPAPVVTPLALDRTPDSDPGEGAPRIEINETGSDGVPLQVRVRAGEVVGLAGLAGHGQPQLLEALFRAAGRRGARSVSTRFQQVTVVGAASNVSGDRRGRGIFSRWSVAANLSLSSLSSISRAGFISRTGESELVSRWWGRLDIRGRPADPIGSLSGGNQQKALLARALAARSDLLLLDDPTRGVDQSTKEEIYALLRAQAREGRCVVWYSTENEELRHCDRVLVFRSGRIVDTLVGAEVTEDRVITASFTGNL